MIIHDPEGRIDDIPLEDLVRFFAKYKLKLAKWPDGSLAAVTALQPKDYGDDGWTHATTGPMASPQLPMKSRLMAFLRGHIS